MGFPKSDMGLEIDAKGITPCIEEYMQTLLKIVKKVDKLEHRHYTLL
jgi:hypothetical protein